MRMEGKVAIVTGGARGIGEAIARLFAAEGACVTIGDIRAEEGRKVAKEIAEGGGRARFIILDVTKEEDWHAAIETTVKEFGKLNVLVNNAGIYSPEVVDETSLETWEQSMAVHATGPFIGTKLALPEMKKAGGGSIVNMSSAFGIVATYEAAAYTASKGALRILTKATAAQYGRYNIRANSIHPGPIDTGMPGTRTLHDLPMGRMGRPEEIAEGALYLASDQSSFVTGIELPIDGGRIVV